MFFLDSLMIAGIQWTLKTVVAAAEAEMNDDSALRDRLLEAEMQREMGEISDDEFRAIEADLLQAIREIKERREGGSGAFAFGGAQPIETGRDGQFQIEAEIAGDFYGASATPAPHTIDIAAEPEPATAPAAAATRTTATRTRTSRTRPRGTTRTTRAK